VEILLEIGSYAGLAAVVGLAILSALYFSQARDLKRLREWAGRAPERTADAEGRARAAAQPTGAAQQVPGPGAPRPAPGAPAPAAASGAAPSQTAVMPATPAAGAAQQTAGGNGAAAPPEEEQREAEEREETGEREKAPPVAPATAGAAATRPSPPPARPTAPPGTAPRIPPPPSMGPTPTGGVRSPWYRRIPAVYAILAGIAVLALGAAGGYVAVEELAGNEATTTRGGAAAEPEGDGERPRRRSIAPSSVTFSVLNGTTVDGLAKRYADRLEARGYRRGNVTNATEQQKAESVVLYANGARRSALSVARRLRISQLEKIDPESQALAGDATVVVVLGNDKVSG
jgi:hypothetical protein